MRTFQALYLLIFVCFYLFLSFAAYKSVFSITRLKEIKNYPANFIIVTSILIISGFLILYVWPFNVRIIESYKYHLIFNALLSIDLVAKLPLAMSFSAGLLMKASKRQIAYYIGLIISVAISGSMLYGVFLGNKELNIKYLNVESKQIPLAFNGYRIIQISDLHLGSFFKSKHLLEKLHDELASKDFDIILFTGDLVNNFADETDSWETTLQSLTANHLSYSILGNHDYGNYSDWNDENSKRANNKKIVEAHQKFGFKILNNENAKVIKQNDTMYVVGVENWGHPPFPQYANLDKALTGIPHGAFTILLSHDPAHWDEVVKFRDDILLTLSGHTHGLQWGISRAGFRFSLSTLTRRNWSGVYRFNNVFLNVNTGLGMVAIPWRVNMPPEISVITLKSVEID